MVIFLGNQFESDEFNNDLSQYEQQKYIDWNAVLWRQKQLQNQLQNDSNLDFTTGKSLNVKKEVPF